MEKRQLFPPEIIQFTSESHFVEHNKQFRLIYIGITVGFLLVLTSLPFIKVTISTQSRGIVRTIHENMDLQPTIYGQVDFSQITEGNSVQKGDTLLTLRTERIDEQIKLYERQLKDNVDYIADLDVLLSGKSLLKTTRFQQESNQHQAKLREMNVSFERLKKEYEIADYLFKEKVVAEVEYLQTKNSFDLIQSQISFYKQQISNNLEIERTRLIQEKDQIETSIKQLKQDKTQYVLTAPISGTLTNVAGIQSGSFLGPGQIIARISPDDALLAECFLLPKDIGFVFDNQPVRFQIDAFNYNQWGLLLGEVIDISKDIVIIDNNPMFRVRCKIYQDHLVLKTGHIGYLKKGMTLTGQFELTERSLFQLLFDKVDNWLNPKLKNI